jgi:hypothetical protein
MDPHAHTDGAGYEKRDVLFGPSFRAGLYILASMVLTALVVVPIYRLLVRREAAAQKKPVTELTTDALPPEPSFPRLLESEPRALAEFRAQEEALLTSYAWVEKDRGLVRIPVEEAMGLVASRGALPTFPEATPGGAAAR